MGRVLNEGFDINKLIRTPTFIPAGTSLGDALRKMQKTRVHFMFVIDEHGGIEGILTLEDLLEEIVGEISDEYDEEVREQIRRDGDAFVLDGMLTVRDANRKLNLGLPEDNSYTTIAGFLMARAGRMLKSGDVIEDDAGLFTIETLDNRRITLIRFVPAGEKRGSVAGSLAALITASLMASDAAVAIEDKFGYLL